MTVVVEGDVGRSLVTINDVLVAVYRVVWELLRTMVNLAGVGGEKKCSSSRSGEANGELL